MPLIIFENVHDLDVTNGITLNMNNVPYQAFQVIGCNELTVSNIQLMNQVYNSKFPILQFEQIATSLTIRDIVLNNLTLLSGSQFLKLVNCNKTLVTNVNASTI